jgi:hypothetical protein
MSLSLTVAERILVAARQLADEQGTFTAEDLVVRAWQLYPEHFALQGHPNYPDSNRVLTKIMGTSGLRGKGWIARVGTKRYRITDVGRVAATELEARLAGEGASRLGGLRLAAADRWVVSALHRMLASPAFEKRGRGETLSFSDVCTFWNISSRTTANQFLKQTQHADKAIQLAADQLGPEEVDYLTLPGEQQPITRADVERLRELSMALRIQFAKDIEIILGRADERRY